MTCCFCGEDIPSIRVGFQRVIGWEQWRDAGGTNALALREPQDEWACQRCIDERRKGLANQESLL